MTQEKREELEAEFWSGMISNEDRRSELERYNIRNIQDFFLTLINNKDFYNGSKFVKSFIMLHQNTCASLKSFYIDRNSGFNLECKYNGRTLFGMCFPVFQNEAQSVLKAVEYASTGAFYLAHERVLVDIISGDSPYSEKLRATMRAMFELPSYSNIYGYLDMIAAFTSPELLDRALKACECLTMEEVKEIALAEENQTMDSVK